VGPDVGLCLVLQFVQCLSSDVGLCSGKSQDTRSSVLYACRGWVVQISSCLTHEDMKSVSLDCCGDFTGALSHMSGNVSVARITYDF
jgi:hypothetical protein